MSRRRASRWSPNQRAGLADLRALAVAHPDDILEVGQPYELPSSSGSWLFVKATISTRSIDLPSDSNLILPVEDVIFAIGVAYPAKPPKIYVDHDRFVDVVHVLYGNNLCIYLDEDREWHPAGGIADVLEQVWSFFENAANGRFDPTTALFDPVGGLNPATGGAPTAVVRAFPGVPGKTMSIGSARPRTKQRVDIEPKALGDERQIRTLTVTVPKRMPFGPGRTLEELLNTIQTSGGPKPAPVLFALQRTLAANACEEPLYITVAVARDPQGHRGWHLCTARIPCSPAARRAALLAETSELFARRIDIKTSLEWCNMSDERKDQTTRRDANRPVHSLRGRTVEVWGCGALGSWIAEFLVRAGVRRIRLRDSSSIRGGLLVRQNYVEADIGFAKATQLQARLEAISDDVEVESIVGSAVAASTNDADLIVDATVNEAVAAGLQPTPGGPLLVSVATDTESATLGLLVVGSSSHSPAQVQNLLAPEVSSRDDLEPFHRLWAESEPAALVLPAPGCSTPTFHGSAADAAGLAAAMVSLIANHLDVDLGGMHLVNMPHSGISAPGQLFLEMEK